MLSCPDLGERFAALRFRMAGATSTYHQTAAGCALLAQVKRAQPTVITAMGGANCEGEMARGIASLSAPIDYIFSGECESAFADFLRRVVSGPALAVRPHCPRLMSGLAQSEISSSIHTSVLVPRSLDLSAPRRARTKSQGSDRPAPAGLTSTLGSKWGESPLYIKTNHAFQLREAA